MDVQEDTPKASPAAAEATEADEVGHPEQGEHQDQIPGGRYHIVERLSTSAIGAVYKALDTVLDRPVAVKCVRLDTPLADQGPDELQERFVREARIAARLQHPNIVTIHDIVATPNRGYIIMEFIEGRTLESLITSEGRLPLSTAIKILSQLSSALDYAHGKNVVHRDVKPANILVSPDMYAWVADFGIAKSELSTNLTMAGGVLGAPDYMSPEQAKGEDVDSRSDLFSLGCILFEAAVGEKPFRSPSLTGVLLSIINDEPVFPLNWRTLGLPTELKPILHHSLEKQREKRFASGEDMMAALEAIPKDAVEAADVAAGAQPAPAKSVDSDEITVDSTPDAPAGPADETPENVAVEESPGGEETAAEAKSEDSPEEVKSEETAEETTPTELQAEAEAVAETKPAATEPAATQEESSDNAISEASGGEAKADSESAEAKTDEASVDDRPAEPEADAGEPETDAQSEEPKAEEAESDQSEVEAKAKDEEPEGEVKPQEPQEAAKTKESEDVEPEDVEDEPEEPAASAEQIQSLKEESQVLHLSPTLSGDLRGVEISPEEGFLLSRIDGASRPNDIISVSPMTEAATACALMDLLHKGLIRLGGVTREPVSASVPPPPPKPKPKPAPGPDAATVSEVDRLLALAESKDYPALLEIPTDAPEKKRKSAYLKIVAKFHPDKFPNADEDFREKISGLCAAASEAVSDFEKSVAAKKERERETSAPTNGPTGPTNGGETAPYDKRRHARGLYDRASTAYERADYWDAIQLGRQAVEVDEHVAEYYGFLGRALLQNKKWRKEAADNFLKATELEPSSIEFLGMLGAIYDSEGLTTRASSLLERARAVDPDYEFPDLDGPEVATD